MNVTEMGNGEYCVELYDKEESIVSQWANDYHIDNEQVIKEWLSKTIEMHKMLHPSSTTYREEIKKILSEGKNDDG